jgi:Flp pilus assembly protein TadB
MRPTSFRFNLAQARLWRQQRAIVGDREAQEMADPTNVTDHSLADAHKDALTAANNSWTETDKLYLSVCSAVIAAAALFGHTPKAVAFVGILVLLLSINWMLLIKRYRRKIIAALGELADHGAIIRNRLAAQFGEDAFGVLKLKLDSSLLCSTEESESFESLGSV